MNWIWLKRWLPIVSGVMGTQMVIQALSALTGLLLMHTLPRGSAAAWLTVATSMLNVIALLSDSGTGVATNTLGGAVWQDRAKLSQVIQAVTRYRRWLAGLAALGVLPWTIVLLYRSQAPWWSIVLTVLAISASTFPSTAAQIYGAINRLHSNYRPQLLADLGLAGTRLGLTLLGILPVVAMFGLLPKDQVPAGYPIHYSFLVAVFAAALPAFLHYRWVRGQAQKFLSPEAPATTEYDARIRKTIWDIFPSTLYFCFQGQLSVWLIVLLGGSARTADVGALMRISILFSVFGAPITQIAGPAYVRCQNRQQLKWQFAKVCSAFGVFSVFALAAAFLFPRQILWVLGPQYAHLTRELPLAVIGLIVNGYSGIVWGLAMSRGWTQLTSWAIPVGLVAQVIGFFAFNLSQVTGVLIFNAFTSLPSVLLAAGIVWHGFRHKMKQAIQESTAHDSNL